MFSSPVLQIGVSLAIFSSSGKIPLFKEELKILNRGVLNGPKLFQITLKLILSWPGLKELKASFNSFIVNGFSGCIIYCFRRYASKVFAGVSIFLEIFGPMPVKCVLKCFAMTSMPVTILLFVLIFCGNNFLMLFIFPMESLITSQVRLKIILIFHYQIWVI